MPKPPKMSPLPAYCFHAALANALSVHWHVLRGNLVTASTQLYCAATEVVCDPKPYTISSVDCSHAPIQPTAEELKIANKAMGNVTDL